MYNEKKYIKTYEVLNIKNISDMYYLFYILTYMRALCIRRCHEILLRIITPYYSDIRLQECMDCHHRQFARIHFCSNKHRYISEKEWK